MKKNKRRGGGGFSHLFLSNNASAKNERLDKIHRIFVISDLHTDNKSNMDWLEKKCSSSSSSCHEHPMTSSSHIATRPRPTAKDCIVIAGDISHDLSILEQTFRMIQDGFHCPIFYIWGNHEAWVGGSKLNNLGIFDSLQKIDIIIDLCSTLGVHTDHALIGSAMSRPLWILPIESWYDGSLELPGCNDLCSDFASWPWVDFIRCQWPEQFNDVTKKNRIPIGLNDYLLRRNHDRIHHIRSHFEHSFSSDSSYSSSSSSSVPSSSSTTIPGLLTFSHFLPNSKTLPDWKNIDSHTFDRIHWLNHPAPAISAKFARVAGSNSIDEQIRQIIPNNNTKTTNISHLHLFGHSHRPKDFYFHNIRYIHNPLGKPREREAGMIGMDVDFKLVWDTTTTKGEISSPSIIRYWEDYGGGLEAIETFVRMKKGGLGGGVGIGRKKMNDLE